MEQKKLKAEVVFITCLLILTGIFYYSGCASNSTGPSNNNNNQDPNIVKFDSLQISPYQNSVKNYSAVNLYTGKVLTDSDRTRDINMRDSGSLNYYFKSGDTLVTPPAAAGYTTYFMQLNYGTITRAQFDTISVIPGGFNGNAKSTIRMGCFTISNNQNRVFAFYLAGKYNSGVTTNPVYGLIYLEFGHGGGILPLSETVSVRLNKGGVNKFK